MISHRKEIRKLTFRAQALNSSKKFASVSKVPVYVILHLNSTRDKLKIKSIDSLEENKPHTCV